MSETALRRWLQTLRRAAGEPWTRSHSRNHADLPMGSPEPQFSISSIAASPIQHPFSLEKPGQGCELLSHCWEGGFAWPRRGAHAVSISFSLHPEGMKKGRNICGRESCSCLLALLQGKQSCTGMTFLSSWTPSRLRRSCRHKETPTRSSAR